MAKHKHVEISSPAGFAPTTLGMAALTDIQPSSKFLKADGRPFDPEVYPQYAALMTPLTDVVDSLCYSGLLSKFAGLGDYTSAILYTSEDGVEYRGVLGKVVGGTGGGVGVIYSSATALFIPETGTTDVHVSTDGITFTPHTLAGASLTGFGGVANSKLFVFDGDGSIWHSSNNGATWSHITAGTTGATGQLNGVAHNGTIYQFVGDGAGAGEILTTPDLAIFTARTSAGTGPIKCTLWNTTLALFISGGTDLGLAASEIQTSANGTAYTLRVSTGVIVNQLLTANTNIIVALGDDIQTSANGTAWTKKLDCAQTVLYAAYNPIEGIVAGIAGGSSDYVVTSPDANVFTETTQDGSAYLTPIQNWVNGHAQNVPAWVQALP